MQIVQMEALRSTSGFIILSGKFLTIDKQAISREHTKARSREDGGGWESEQRKVFRLDVRSLVGAGRLLASRNNENGKQRTSS